GSSNVIKTAYIKKLNKNIVLKRKKDDESNKKFFREAQNLHKIMANENVVKLMGISRDPSDGFYYTVLEYVYGQDLRSYLQKNFHELSWSTKIEMGKGIAEGLNYVHYSNVIHCNLNPKNILINGNRPVITGFSSSMLLDKSNDKASIDSHENSYDGFVNLAYFDPTYLKPETSGCQKDKCFDIYSLVKHVSISVHYNGLKFKGSFSPKACLSEVRRLLSERILINEDDIRLDEIIHENSIRIVSLSTPDWSSFVKTCEYGFQITKEGHKKASKKAIVIGDYEKESLNTREETIRHISHLEHLCELNLASNSSDIILPWLSICLKLTKKNLEELSEISSNTYNISEHPMTCIKMS
ncbi:2457_t:CDS:2, partial [Acaulospora morrowiae]